MTSTKTLNVRKLKQTIITNLLRIPPPPLHLCILTKLLRMPSICRAYIKQYNIEIFTFFVAIVLGTCFTIWLEFALWFIHVKSFFFQSQI